MKNKLIISIFFLVIVSIISMFLYFDFREDYIHTISETDYVNVEILLDEIQYFTNVGIDLENYYGLEDLISRRVAAYPLSEGMAVFNKEGVLLAASNEIYIEDNYWDINEYQLIKGTSAYFSVTPIKQEKQIGFIVNKLDSRTIKSDLLKYMTGCIGIYLLVIFIYFILYKIFDLKKKLLFNVITVQALATIFKVYFHYRYVLSVVYREFNVFISSLKASLMPMITYDIPLSSIRGSEAYIDGIAGKIGAFSRIDIFVDQDILIHYVLDYDYLLSMLSNSVISSLILGAIITFFLLEMTNIYTSISRPTRERIGKLRSIGFIFFLPYSISAVFVPLRMVEFNASNTLVFATVSAEAIMVTLVAFICGQYIERYGIVTMYKVGALLFSLGFFMSYLANDAQVFLLSRVVEGIGFGISLISMRVEAVSGQDHTRINEDVATFSIGVFSAVNIGSLLGGIIADNIGLKNVFMISSITSLIGALICSYFITGVIDQDQEKSTIVGNMKRILSNKRFIICCLLFLVPVKLMSGFLDYLFPVFAKDTLQWSYTIISRGYLLNSLLIIMAGANIVRFVNRKLKLEIKLMLINLVIASAYFMLGLFGNSLGLLMGIMLISMIQSFAEGSFLELYYGFEITQSMGKVKSICCYSIIDRFFIIVIPYVFASLLAGNMNVRIISFAGLLLLLLMVQVRYNSKIVKLESSN